MSKVSMYQNKTVLVTGGSGFIGELVCQKLVAQNASVHSVSRKKMTDNMGLTWWQGDLAEINFVRNMFDHIEPQIVIHLASEVTGKREIEYVLPTLNGNLLSAVNLLICATDYACERIILAGSLEEPDQMDANPTPCSPYAAAKWAGTAYARMFHSLYKTPVAIARLFMVYGPHQKDLLKLIPYICLSLIDNNIPKLANGAREVDWVHVDDVVEGLLLMGTALGIENNTIELGTGQLFTTGYVAEKLCEISAGKIKPEFGALPERAMERVKKANIKQTAQLIGWQPKISLDQGLENTFSWYQEKVRKGI